VDENLVSIIIFSFTVLQALGFARNLDRLSICILTILLMNIKRTLLTITKLCQNLPRWGVWLGLAIVVAISIISTKDFELFQLLERLISQTENNYQKWGESQPLANPSVLILFAFGGGLLASISPCILAMLPVNLSYIGTLNVKSRQEAFWNATGFVLGVVTILSMFGLFSSVAGAIMVEWRGYINLAVGALIILMGLSIGGLFHLPLPQAQISLPLIAGTYGVGLTFAIVSSPCASPVLFAVLAAAAATGSRMECIDDGGLCLGLHGSNFCN
jgi:cytochrome c-type biogenesis protein